MSNFQNAMQAVVDLAAVQPSQLNYVKNLPLREALWWFIENGNDDLPNRSEIFFTLRERMRTEPTSSMQHTGEQCPAEARHAQIGGTRKADGPDYVVRVELSVTAGSSAQAAEFALDDLRDLALGPISFEVENLASGHADQVLAGRSMTTWERDDIQFPRLLAEISATQVTLDLVSLAESMDVTVQELNALFDRAGRAWEVIKTRAAPIRIST